MNIVLFEAGEVEAGYLPVEDERVGHVRGVLRRAEGEVFDAGVINGAKGKATVTGYGEAAMRFSFRPTAEGAGLLPIDVVVGLSRPQTMRKILNEAAALGVRSIRFVATERGEASYAESRLWTTGEWRRHVVAGVGQAFETRLPQVMWGQSLEEAIRAVSRNLDTVRRMEWEMEGPPQAFDERKGETLWLALDNYEGTMRLGKALRYGCGEAVLAIGSERGWTRAEREALRAGGFRLVDLGERVLRTETAVVAAVSVTREALALG